MIYSIIRIDINCKCYVDLDTPVVPSWLRENNPTRSVTDLGTSAPDIEYAAKLQLNITKKKDSENGI